MKNWSGWPRRKWRRRDWHPSARELARQAGCAIYSHVQYPNALTLKVNGRTFTRLGATVEAAVRAAEGQTPNQWLVAMSHAYLAFAHQHPKLRRALFDVDMRSDGPVPDWYGQAMAQLFSFITTPLTEIFPDFDAGELDLMTRTLFSNVQGIVLLGLENRIFGVPGEQLKTMIRLLLEQVGSQNGQDAPTIGQGRRVLSYLRTAQRLG